MINYYYGNLKDATITEGDISEKAQYPVANINYLDKNLYTYLDDNDETVTDESEYYWELVKIDVGSSINSSSCVLDLSNFNIQFAVVGSEDIIEYNIMLQGSNDDVVYTETAILLTKVVGNASINDTLTEIYTGTYAEIAYRYYRLIITIELTASDDVTWDFDGKINNLYMGDYISLPSPQLVPYGFKHKTKIAEAFGGSRFGVDTQGQRKTWGFKFNGLDNDDKTNWEAFDLVCKLGVVPCYMESYEGSTQIIDPHFVSVYGGEILQQVAYRLYEMNNNVEEEL
jgi:hypothetical protein